MHPSPWSLPPPGRTTLSMARVPDHEHPPLEHSHRPIHPRIPRRNPKRSPGRAPLVPNLVARRPAAVHHGARLRDRMAVAERHACARAIGHQWESHLCPRCGAGGVEAVRQFESAHGRITNCPSGGAGLSGIEMNRFAKIACCLQCYSVYRSTLCLYLCVQDPSSSRLSSLLSLSYHDHGSGGGGGFRKQKRSLEKRIYNLMSGVEVFCFVISVCKKKREEKAKCVLK